MAIRTSDLHYDLPAERIAQRPCEPRDAARLMVLRRSTGRIEHRFFRDLPAYLSPSDCLVVNATRVIPARFAARRESGGRLEGLFLRELETGVWRVLLRGAGRVKEDEPLTLVSMGEAGEAGGALPSDDRPPATEKIRPAWRLRILRRLDRGECEVAVEPADAAEVVLDEIGRPPLPPYIQRKDLGDASIAALDRQRYQTVYARMPGAVAAPTAGMHFTPVLLERIRKMGVRIPEVVLHVGLGTFQPIEAEDLSQHPMHEEWYDLPQDAAAEIERTRAADGRVIAVGTTAARVLESCATASGIRAGAGWTRLLIYPPYQFRVTDALLTNFHLPGSTLLAMVCALAGRERILAAYELAIREGYRFFSYGDAMLIC